MTSAGTDDRHLLAGLHAPRRNHYFFGKVLGVSDLQMEQDYVRGADAQLARLVLGAGVVCGLEVTAAQDADQPGIRVSAGLALDGLGRRVVVPCDTDVALPADVPLSATMTVRLRYRVHGADRVASLSGHDEEVRHLEAGTWVEGYRVEIREGPEPSESADCSEATLDLIRAGRLAEALTALAQTASVHDVSDPGVTLATIAADADGGLTVDARAARAVVPTNIVLLKLIACLAARVDECCAASAPPPMPAQAS